MTIGKRVSMINKGLSAKSYVQDGCVALWDGIENDGFGAHSDSTTQWKDCISGLLYSGKFTSVTSNGLYSNGASADSCYLTASNPLSSSLSELTMEVVLTTEENSAYQCWVPFSSHDISRDRFQFNTEGNMRFHPIAGRVVYTINTDITSINDKKGTLCVTWDGTYMYLYLNGQLKGKEGVSSSQWSAMYSNGSISLFSRYLLDVGYGYIETFKGTIHGNRLYNRALTTAEIAANYAIDKARFGLS